MNISGTVEPFCNVIVLATLSTLSIQCCQIKKNVQILQFTTKLGPLAFRKMFRKVVVRGVRERWRVLRFFVYCRQDCMPCFLISLFVTISSEELKINSFSCQVATRKLLVRCGLSPEFETFTTCMSDKRSSYRKLPSCLGFLSC